MSGEGKPLNKLTDSIADGEAVDWDKLYSVDGADDIRQIVDQLRIIAGVANVHRAQIGESITTPGAPPQPAPPTPPPAGAAERWGHFLLIRKIGEGAFGEVFEAHDTWLDHPRALKLIKPEVASGDSAQLILHEARKLVRVRHQNVVMVHGADRHEGRVGFWMDLIEGDTLEERVLEGRLSAGEATHIGQELCLALAAVHHAGLLHRDVKAQNVMRASDGGRIILMDFGAGEFRNAPAIGRRFGTPLYLAPELIAGEGATVQSDIYALGVLLYYLVSGQFPITAESLDDLARAHMRGARRPLHDVRPDLPSAFVSVVERATNADPAKRFLSAGDFHTALAERVGTVTDHSPGSSSVAPSAVPEPLAYTLVAAAALGAVGAFCGLVACRTFEVALHIQPEFAAGPAEYLSTGTNCLIPFALHWIAFVALVTLVNGAHVALGTRVDRFLLPAVQRIQSLRSTSLALLIPVCVAICWLASTWWSWAVFDTLWALQAGAGLAGNGPTLLDPALYTMNLLYGELSTILTFVLIFAVWRWWPWLERHADDLAAVRRMKWVTVVLVLAIITSASAPRRVFFDKLEVVLYRNEPSLVIGTKGDELLLLSIANPGGTVRPRVNRSAGDVQATGRRRSLVGRE